jgi:monofunctional biosynthetic peptidoglycan transglycosylase
VIRRGVKWTAWLVAGLVTAGAGWFLTLPDGSEFARANPRQTSLMKVREAAGIRSQPMTWRPLSQMAPALRHAVIVAEDANFYRHHGIDWEAAWEALERNVEERRLYRGGSTITQQLAKNLYLDPEKTLWRKFTEALIALRMERRLKKARILELYLNVVEWGRGIYGADAAARHYFNTLAAELTIQEAAWLAAILPSPLRYEANPSAVGPRAAVIQQFLERRLGPVPEIGRPPQVDEKNPMQLQGVEETPPDRTFPNAIDGQDTEKAQTFQ